MHGCSVFYLRADGCKVAHKGVGGGCYETVKCPSHAVTEYAALMEYYANDSGQERVKIKWWEYVIAGEVYRFELNEKKGAYEKK